MHKINEKLVAFVENMMNDEELDDKFKCKNKCR